MRTKRVWILALILVSGSVSAAPERFLKFRSTRVDCVLALTAASGGGPDLIAMKAVSERRIDRVDLTGVGALSTWVSTPLIAVANYFLNRSNVDVSITLPGSGVDYQNFQFGRHPTDKGKLKIVYQLQMKVGENSSSVCFDVEGEFKQGDWEAFQKGKPVEFGFTAEAMRCVERSIGPHLDRTLPAVSQYFYMNLSCRAGTSETGRRELNLAEPAVFKGTRSSLEFWGPAQIWDTEVGLTDRVPPSDPE